MTQLYDFFGEQIAGFFKIKSQHLLIAAQNTQLGNSLAAFAFHQSLMIDACIIHQLFQQQTVFIITCHTAHKNLTFQMCQIGSNVCCTAQHGIYFCNTCYRHRRFRRNAFYLTLKISVQHHIADNSNAYILNLFR